MDKLLEYLNLVNISFFKLNTASTPEYKWLFGILGAIALFFYGLTLGRTRALISLLSIYITFTIYRLFPYFEELKNMVTRPWLDDYFLRLGLFLAIYALIFIILSLSFARKRLSASEFSFFAVLVLSILQIGLLTSIIISLLPETLMIKLLGKFYELFGGQQALFFWALAPLPVLLFMRGK